MTSPGRPRGAPARTVLFVCHANTARSVMAQALFERILAERNLGGAVHVRSGGVAPYARDGMIPSLDARLALREVGIALAEDAIRSTDLRCHPDLVAEADLIVSMTAQQKAVIEGYPEARGKPVVTLRELAGETGDIGDPAGQGEPAFRACRDEILRCLDRALDRLLAACALPTHDPWPPRSARSGRPDRARRAGASSAGFGAVNESPGAARRL